MRYNLDALRFQFEWRGNALMNLNKRVCNTCYDKPFEHYRPIIVPPDPVPAWMPRPDQYAPLMPFAVTDNMGRAVLDAAGQPVYASSQFDPLTVTETGVPVNVFVPGAGFLTTQQGQPIIVANIVMQPGIEDGYRLESPDGGMVFLIPD
ncbi:MAG TPA: hypothetical protein PKX13_11980 [Acidiphilium sp.]|nr:hypothetical protein [Acidiphilium sp.]